MLSTKSKRGIPGFLPAPDTAWSDVITTESIPNSSKIGFNVITRPVVVQLACGATNPFHPLFFCFSNSGTC